MDEIYPSKGTGDDGIHAIASTWKANLGVPATVSEDVSLSHFDESQLSIIAVGEIVLKPDTLAWDKRLEDAKAC